MFLISSSVFLWNIKSYFNFSSYERANVFRFFLVSFFIIVCFIDFMANINIIIGIRNRDNSDLRIIKINISSSEAYLSRYASLLLESYPLS